MFCILWRFKPLPHQVAAFEAAYAPQGAWGTLFSRAEGYLGTDLLKARDDSGAYITVDRWESDQAYWRFRQRFHAQYSELDMRMEGLTLEETFLGQFDGLP